LDTRTDGQPILLSYILVTDLIQDVFLLDRILYSIPHLLRPYRQIWHLAFSECTWYHFTGNVRIVILRCWDRRWRHFHLLLANNKVLYWRLGRLCIWLVDPMFPRWRAHPSLGYQVAYVHRYVTHILVLDSSILCTVACSVIGFVLCTIPKIHYQVLLVATAIVGASVVMLGADCFSTAGLKEVFSLTSILSVHVLIFSYAVLCLEYWIPEPISQVHRA
jgi:hypothetical protein